MISVDVTHLVSFGDPDADLLPLQYCICGEKFGYWREVLYEANDDPDRLWECPHCKRKLYFTNKITVYEVKDA